VASKVVRYIEKQIIETLGNVNAHEVTAKEYEDKAEENRRRATEYKMQYDELMVDLEKIDPVLWAAYKEAE